MLYELMKKKNKLQEAVILNKSKWLTLSPLTSV